MTADRMVQIANHNTDLPILPDLAGCGVVSVLCGLSILRIPTKKTCILDTRCRNTRWDIV